MAVAPPIQPTEPDIHVLTSISPASAEVANQAFGAGGVTYQVGTECARVFGWPLCQTDADAVKFEDEYGGDANFVPFYVYHAMTCPDNYNHLDSEQRRATLAVQTFEAIKHQGVARQLWWGEADPNQACLVSSAEVLGGSVVVTDPIHCIARLVAARKRLSGSGTVLIHGPWVLVPYLVSKNVLVIRNRQLVGPGFIYVTDDGYPDDAHPASGVTAGPGAIYPTRDNPFDDVAGEVWLYATGRVEYGFGQYVGKDTLGAPLDGDGKMSRFTSWSHRTNELMIRVEQQAFLRFDYCNILAQKAYVPTISLGED